MLPHESLKNRLITVVVRLGLKATFSVTFSLTSSVIQESLGWFLRKKKSYWSIFIRLSLNVPYQRLFRKISLRRIGHSACLIDMVGQSYPIYACAGTSRARNFIDSRWILRLLEAKVFLKQRLKKTRGKKVLSVWNDSEIYNLWKKKAISSDIDAEGSSNRSFMVKICILE